MSEELVNDIMVEDIPDPPPFVKVQGKGLVKEVKVGDPNEKGGVFVQVTVAYPLGDIDPKEISAGIYLQLEASKKADQALLGEGWTPGQIGAMRGNIHRAKDLLKATGIDTTGKTLLQALPEAAGNVIGFGAGPQKNESWRPQFTSFYKPKD